MWKMKAIMENFMHPGRLETLIPVREGQWVLETLHYKIYKTVCPGGGQGHFLPRCPKYSAMRGTHYQRPSTLNLDLSEGEEETPHSTRIRGANNQNRCRMCYCITPTEEDTRNPIDPPATNLYILFFHLIQSHNSDSCPLTPSSPL